MKTSTSTLNGPTPQRALIPSVGTNFAPPVEFIRALADPFTYSIRNADVVFGFLWGLPVPFVTMAIHLHVALLTTSWASIGQVLDLHPVYYFFAAHPLLFAVVFGAQGTLRRRRDQRIAALLAMEVARYEELCRANTRLEELDRLKSEFLANVTHELKSPLVTALGYTDRIIGKHLGDVNERQLKGLEISKRNLIRLRRLIDEILDFSRLEAGIAHFEKTSVDLRDAVHIAVENLTLRAREKHIIFQVNLPATPVVVCGDHHRLAQVTINLLDNAVKFTPENGRIEISIEKTDAAWRLCVDDNGIGIPADIVPKLFERFHQADGSLARPHEGVGLGLVIVRKILEAHQGRVWIESTEGVGTRLLVELPPAETVSEPVEGAGTVSGSGKKDVKGGIHAAHTTH